MEKNHNENSSPTSVTPTGFVDEPCSSKSTSTITTPITRESASIADVNKNNTVLFLQNISKYLNFAELHDIISAFGLVERMQVKSRSTFNDFYIKFKHAKDAKAALDKMHGMKIGDVSFRCTLYSHKNLVYKDDDYIPEVDLSIPKLESRKTDVLKPVYNMVTVEEGHNRAKVFNHLNSLICKPKITPDTFTVFGRNSYLVKVEPSQGYMLQGTSKNYRDSGILSIRPYDEYNGSKGKIYNNDLSKLPKEQFLALCPSHVVDCHNIQSYDKTSKSFVNTPLIILKFSSGLPPDEVVIGPFRAKVRSYVCSPKTCKSCFKFGHTKKFCRTNLNLCLHCDASLDSHDEDMRNHCSNPPRCHHCGENSTHRTFNNNCPEYKNQQEICNIAYNNRTSFFEAKKIFNQKNGISYSTTVATPPSQPPIPHKRDSASASAAAAAPERTDCASAHTTKNHSLHKSISSQSRSTERETSKQSSRASDSDPSVKPKTSIKLVQAVASTSGYQKEHKSIRRTPSLPDVLYTSEDLPPSIEAEFTKPKNAKSHSSKKPSKEEQPKNKKEQHVLETSNIFEHLPAENTHENLDIDSPLMDVDSSNLKRKSSDPSDEPVSSSQTVKKKAILEKDRQLKIVKGSGNATTKLSDSKSIKTTNKIKTQR